MPSSLIGIQAAELTSSFVETVKVAEETFGKIVSDSIVDDASQSQL